MSAPTGKGKKNKPKSRLNLLVDLVNEKRESEANKHPIDDLLLAMLKQSVGISPTAARPGEWSCSKR